MLNAFYHFFYLLDANENTDDLIPAHTREGNCLKSKKNKLLDASFCFSLSWAVFRNTLSGTMTGRFHCVRVVLTISNKCWWSKRCPVSLSGFRLLVISHQKERSLEVTWRTLHSFWDYTGLGGLTGGDLSHCWIGTTAKKDESVIHSVFHIHQSWVWSLCLI